jgi:DNA-binding PucR family transcriptional regulator
MAPDDLGVRTKVAPPADNVRRFASLSEIARLINSSSDLPAVLNRIVTAVCQHSSWSSCGIMSVNRKAGRSELVVRFDPRLDPAANPATSWKLEESATMRVVETNQLVIIPDAQACDEFLAYKEDSRARGYHTVVILPLGTTDRHGREMTIAVHSRDIVDVSETELAFLVTVTQLASIAVERAKLLQMEQDRTRRLHRTIEISTELMEGVLAEDAMEATIAKVAAVLPYPLIMADFAAGTFSVRRSPVPTIFSEGEWKRVVRDHLGPAITELVRSAVADGKKNGRLLPVGRDAAATLSPLVEPLRVNNETMGGLLIFPSGNITDDFDGILVHAARLALDVQLMRDYVRFRSEANSIAELFKALFAGPPRQTTELIARARRLGNSLPGPARLVAIGFPSDSGDFDGRISGLQLSLARSVAEIRPGTVVVADDDSIIFAPVSAREEPAVWDSFMRRVIATVENLAGVKPIAAESRVCRRLADYRDARLECGRVLDLARMFGKSGRVAQSDFGPFAVLLSAVDQPSARAFVRDSLGAIESYDVEHGTQLLSTLSAFVDEGCRYQSCADRMRIHVSTLRYRLERLKELFGIDLEKSDSVFGLTLALKLRELALERSNHVEGAQ